MIPQVNWSWLRDWTQWTSTTTSSATITNVTVLDYQEPESLRCDCACEAIKRVVNQGSHA